LRLGAHAGLAAGFEMEGFLSLRSTPLVHSACGYSILRLMLAARRARRPRRWF
jgi:hypothetical protein